MRHAKKWGKYNPYTENKLIIEGTFAEVYRQIWKTNISKQLIQIWSRNKDFEAGIVNMFKKTTEITFKALKEGVMRMSYHRTQIKIYKL